MKKITLIFIFIVSLCNSVQADWFNFGWMNNNTKTQAVSDPDTASKGLQQNLDDVTPDQDANKVQLSAEQKHQALVWGLTESEEKRYLFLMQNKSGNYWSQNELTPVEILGINATTPAERKHFAELDAVQSQQRVAKELAWVMVASQAKTALNKGTPLVQPFNVKPFSPYTNQTTLQNGDTLFLFTSIKTATSHVMTVLLKQSATTNFKLNIYFVDKPSSSAVQTWAQSALIPLDAVKKGSITLNTNAGAFDEIVGDKTLPVLILSRGGKSEKVDLSRF